MYVVETGTHVLYQSAVGTQGHVYQGLLVGNLFASGGEKHLGTALLRVAGNVGHVCTAGIVQTGQKSAKNGVFFLDESLEVTTVVYAVVQGSGKQLTICRQRLLLVATVGRPFIQCCEKRTDLLGGTVQFHVSGIGREPLFQAQHFLVGARFRQGQPGKFRANGIV